MVISRLRTILFAVTFYLGSIAFVVAAAIGTLMSRRLLKAAVRAWVRFHRWCARLAGIRIRIENRPPAGERVLYALRHESYFEAIDLPVLLPDPVVIAKAELMRIPLWGRAARAYGLVGVEREQGARALRKMVAEVRRVSAEGRPVAIFPEGTRVPHGQQAPLQAGFAGLYKLLGMPVVPVALDSGASYGRRPMQAGTVTYRFGEPIPPGLPRAEIEERVLAAINELNN